MFKRITMYYLMTQYTLQVEKKNMFDMFQQESMRRKSTPAHGPGMNLRSKSDNIVSKPLLKYFVRWLGFFCHTIKQWKIKNIPDREAGYYMANFFSKT